MGYEIDFVQAGEESKSGDAIALRWGNLHSNDHSNQYIVVIDGGFAGTGEKLADLINKYYGNPSSIDLVVSTHPDADHINGLSYILDEFDVKKLWIHLPWKHNENIADKFKDGRVTDESIGERLKDACEAAWDLYKKALDNDVTVQEPFSGQQNLFINSHGGQLRILGPSQDYYEELLPEFGGLPPTVEKGIAASFAEMGQRIINKVSELWGRDSIDDNGETSAKNNSSTVLEFVYSEKRSLFTADAGIPALEQVSERAGNEKLKMIQIPHHGSRRNVGPTVLNSIVGGIVGRSESKDITAFVSCAKENPDNKHPNKRVLNAFTRRGCTCYQFNGNFWIHDDSPDRKDYSAIVACEFFGEVEEE